MMEFIVADFGLIVRDSEVGGKFPGLHPVSIKQLHSIFPC